MYNNQFQEDIIDFITNRQVKSVEHKLKEVQLVTDEIHQGQQNNRYSKIISALTDIEQSYLESDEQRKIFIQLIAQTKLNEGIDSILREYVKLISYFAEWDERIITERLFGSIKYSEKNIEKNLNLLCDNYVYLKKGIKTLIKLKISQGVEKDKLNELIMKMNGLDELIEKNKIYNWLPLENEMNSWQHKLLYGDKYNDRFFYVHRVSQNTSNDIDEHLEINNTESNYSGNFIIKLIKKWRNSNHEM